MPSISTIGNRAYPSIPEISEDSVTHTIALQTIKAAAATYERRDRDFVNSFVRFGELVDLGIIDGNGDFALTMPLYTPTNVTTTRAFDADSTTLDEIADVLGTLMADLKDINLVSRS
jgi:hypothetical protein